MNAAAQPQIPDVMVYIMDQGFVLSYDGPDGATRNIAASSVQDAASAFVSICTERQQLRIAQSQQAQARRQQPLPPPYGGVPDPQYNMVPTPHQRPVMLTPPAGLAGARVDYPQVSVPYQEAPDVEVVAPNALRMRGRGGRERSVTFTSAPDPSPYRGTSPTRGYESHQDEDVPRSNAPAKEYENLAVMNRWVARGRDDSGAPFTENEWYDALITYAPHINAREAEVMLGEYKADMMASQEQ